MCKHSVVTDDWVKKGCHIHVEGVELTLAPDHNGKVLVRPYFSMEDDKDVERALKTAIEVCLADTAVREKWIQALRGAIVFMLGYQGVYKELANGRMLEFRFLI